VKELCYKRSEPGPDRQILDQAPATVQCGIMSQIRKSNFSKARIACVGGFLGCGKTTAVIEAAQRLVERGLRICIITNDQGHQLVDTALVRSRGINAVEIGGGCFCCRFDEFAIHAQRLVKQHRAQVILAEAVGSCADLAASVYKRFRQYYSEEFVLAPLTVLVDPHRIREMLGSCPEFDENVRYLFGKQLAEADRVVLTKSDLLSDEEIARLRNDLQQLAGNVPVSVMSARNGSGVDEWVEQIMTGQTGERELELDYALYGRAEACLGWLNASIDLISQKEFHSTDLGEALMASVQESGRIVGWSVAHVKIMLLTADGNNWIALTDSRGPAVWGGSHELSPCLEASMIVNARVVADPLQLRLLIEECVQKVTHSRDIKATVRHLESFSPLPPKPSDVFHDSRSLFP
jgi:G3E family GTPase